MNSLVNFSVSDKLLQVPIQTKTITWKAPSNIALIKYWGKYGVQLPRNPSLSLTLTNAFTETSITYTQKEKGAISIDFSFEGEKNEAFEQKIYKFLSSLLPTQAYLSELHLSIDSKNSFPHSAGIASSASSMAALALCLCSIEKEVLATLQNDEDFYQKASYLARLGSGSAARSVFPVPITTWGQTNLIANSSNEFATPYEKPVHEIFQDYQDTILIVSASEKSVSSRAGHALMETNPFAQTRYELAESNLEKLMQALAEGDTTTFIKVVENEAFVLHALMMASDPPFILMENNTLTIIRKIQQFRNETQIPVCFTLDAGPNVHVLYPKCYAEDVLSFIESDLKYFCVNQHYLKDFTAKQ